ncbi:trehalose operon repressor TreR [Enterobacillus tribolii]|uniref:LacI family transcriptional regulator n=1 Tax=Enterobacillus tribolii TaxID=1487935 RepID=A0A370R1I0_9GAMM|nr:trehalose operon repressor TreR [Enterobacillus tribolii]MBW7983114.1 HTH-type transcriptional regulator TreR [Enterobacillus tribolii]RDK95782.1 LacI family transcriptional regulator [Enterobacillus tribolii]
MSSNRLTIKDIARLSGVGKSTVSRVINREEGVSERTRERVMEIIRQQNFSPSKSARAMRGQSDKVVAIIISRMDSNAENQSVSAMLPLLYERGYDPILLESRFENQRVKEHLAVLAQRNVDGLVLFGFTGLDEKMLHPWRNKMIVVAREYAEIASVCYNDAGAITLLVDKLYQQGHRRIAFIGVKESDATTGSRRHAAYQERCRHYGLTPDASLGELTYQSGYQRVPEVLTPETTAIVCASDTIAIGVSKYLHEHQLEAIQVCGIGNNALLHFLYPQTFSVDPGNAEAGRLAIQQLMGQLHDSQPVRRLTVPCTLTE